ncbi:MAG: malectin domain-containing carbohydrate-binding protein [Cyanobacteria bacterium J06639_14]
MATINFTQIGSFNGVEGGSKVLTNPTSLQFGPDGRLYVAEQNGTINAFTILLENGEYIATAHEELLLPDGSGVVKSIQNHNDDGSLSNQNNRQVTGLAVTGTEENPILYISSSDPRIATNGEKNLDTNSGVVSQVTWTGSEWEAVDIIRGLPRSEENHSVNGMELSPDGTKLYLTVGGNTNNGAPSQFFSYTAEYALSGTVLEIDLDDINSRPVLIDNAPGQNGRQYVYDLPTLDDPTQPNVTDGVGEDEFGLDEAGPWGGNDGFNQAILPADAPLRIFADGLRNHYDIELTEAGQLYTVDNGSNGNLGGNPIAVNGEATNQPNNGGTGDPEPLFLLEDGGYYGHPAPVRSNQDLAWTVYDDTGNPDASVSPNTVPDVSALVPDSIAVQDGFIIDPSKFTADPARLTESGIRIERDSPESNTLANLGSSSNGLVEYTAGAFDGALQGSLVVTQFNGNVTLLNLNADGTALEPLVDPGDDGILGTADDEVIDNDGIYTLVTGQSQPLDVTVAPDGTIWVAEFGPDNINVFAPSDLVLPNDPDFDDDGIFNVSDPFLRDPTNGGSVVVEPGQTLLWDFDANQDDNRPGPSGYGGGLTGVMIDGSTDFEQFFQEPSALPNQIVNLDNVKFTTAAGGGTTVIEVVSQGDPHTNSNDGEYLFHTGVTIAPTVDTFTIKWSIFNPASAFTGSFQQIGGYIGTGDQSNYLKIVAIQHPSGEIQVVLEDNDVVQAESFIQANDLFSVPDNQQIFFELEIDPTAATAIPTVTYETGGSNTTTVSGTALDLSGTAVLDAILGNYTVQGQTSGLAVGLLSSNTGQSEADAFQAIFNDVEITATGTSNEPTVLYRVNAGGPTIAALDSGPNWSADTVASNSSFLVDPGSNQTAKFPAVEPDPTVPSSTPGVIFDTERWDQVGGSEMQWAFDVPAVGLYEVRLYVGNGFNGTNSPGERIYDVAIEGTVPSNLDDLDLSEQYGHQVGTVISNIVTVDDGTLNIDFIHGVENPLINGIEILQLDSDTSAPLTVSFVGSPYTISEGDSQVQLSLLTDTTVPNDESVDITFEIVPGTASPQSDYEYTSATASYDPQTGIYTDTVTIAGSSSDVTVLIDVLQDAIVEGDEAFSVNMIGVSSNAQIGTGSASVTITDDDEPPSANGEAVLTVTANSNNVQISNFGNNAFQFTNTGDKNIAQVNIDVTNALYPDSVFDPFGVAGDTVSKPLTINTNGGTGIIAPSNASYIGAGGTAGFEEVQLLFDATVDGGFEPGETIGFSVDMDPNSIAGAAKGPLDAGTDPAWDVGGVSGAELIGSTFTVTFTDGTTATGQLQGVGNQGGSQGVASQNSPETAVSLTVNGLAAGSVGTYDASGPSVIVNGPAGQTARVVLTKGFIQPVTNEFFNGNASQQAYAPILQAQLDALAASDFPANNAVEFQTVDVVLTGEDQDISDQFDFSGVSDFDFAGEDQLPLGFVGSIIDPNNNDLPLGPVTQPTYLEFNGETAASIGEYGSLNDLNNQWKTISLENTYTNPVVIVSDPTFKGSDPAAVRVRNVTSDSFEFRIQEPNYKDGWHTNESVSYLVMEAGDWMLADGTHISAGTYDSNLLSSSGFETVDLTGFDATPTVLSQVQTANGSDWVVTRSRGQSADGFQLTMQEEEALNNGSHLNETIGWLAIDSGVASDGDTLLQGGSTEQVYQNNPSTVSFETDFNAAPSLIAKLSSFQGGDTANLRLDTITNSSFGVRVYEEQSLDNELNHVPESVSFLALEGQNGLLEGTSI